MMMHGFPLSAKLPEDLGFGERFWYWQGASGQSYIHSIYSIGNCPPLPGAVFVLVRMADGRRQPIGVGRFPGQAQESKRGSGLGLQNANDAAEIHVHLLARNDEAALSVLTDLEGAMKGTEVSSAATGFCGSGQLTLAFA